ncbi:MAG: Thiol-disulfide oxidoreductase ResA [Phycisphaerae bacterium]|nr:Thiol-disulfide oxidoreductase ResA [Phycisphaerae bacterium]
MAIRPLCTSLALLLCSNSPATATPNDDPRTADEVIAGYVTAMGGAEKFAARHSFRMSGRSTSEIGESRWVTEWKRPDRFRTESTPPESRARIVYAFDGRTWWHIMPALGAQPQELPADLATAMSVQVDADGPLVDYAKKGHRVELLGREDPNGKPAYKLRVLLKGAAEGERDDYLIDAQSFLPAKVVSRRLFHGEPAENETRFSDYRPVNGLLVAHTTVQRDCLTGSESTTTVDKVEFNVDIPDERFSLAAAKAEHAKGKPAEPAATPPIRDEPAAHALYDGMVAALRAAQSLSVTCSYRCESGGMPIGRCTYRLWLKKPNHFRMETTAFAGAAAGVMVGDGENLWIFWPQGRPRFNDEDAVAYRQSRDKVYFSEPTPPAHHSISHRSTLLGAGIIMTIVNPSTFHGYTDSLQPYLDGVAARGVEPVRDEPCDVIELSYMNGQRVWKLWLAQRDHLPRRLRETIHVSNDIVKDEDWTEVTINGEISDERFVWQPGPDWKQWYLPEAQTELLKTGTPAPEFESSLADGKRLKLSDLRGKVVLLVFWRVGCPPCREELPYLQKLHEKYAAKGLVVLGFDASDRPELVNNLMKTNAANFPCVVDTSQAAMTMQLETYRSRAVPTSYLIDRDGRILDAWVGYDPASTALARHLRKLGIQD